MTSTHYTTITVQDSSQLEPPKFVTDVAGDAAELQKMKGVHSIKIAAITTENGQEITPVSSLKIETLNAQNNAETIFTYANLATDDTTEQYELANDRSISVWLKHCDLVEPDGAHKTSIYVSYVGSFDEKKVDENTTHLGGKTIVSSRVEIKIDGNSLSVGASKVKGAMFPSNNENLTITDASKDSVKIMCLAGLQSGEQLVEIATILRGSLRNNNPDIRKDIAYTADKKATLSQAMLTAKLTAENGKACVVVGHSADIKSALGYAADDGTYTIGTDKYQVVNVESQYDDNFSIANNRDIDGSIYNGANMSVRASQRAQLFSNDKSLVLTGSTASASTPHPTDAPEIVPIAFGDLKQITKQSLCISFTDNLVADDQVKMNSQLFQTRTIYRVKVVNSDLDAANQEITSVDLAHDELDGAEIDLGSPTVTTVNADGSQTETNRWGHSTLTLTITTMDGSKKLGPSFREPVAGVDFRMFPKIDYKNITFTQDRDDNFTLKDGDMTEGKNYRLISSQLTGAAGDETLQGNLWSFDTNDKAFKSAGNADNTMEYNGTSSLLLTAQSDVATVITGAHKVDMLNNSDEYLPMTAAAYQETSLILKMTKLQQLTKLQGSKDFTFGTDADTGARTVLLKFSEAVNTLADQIFTVSLTSRHCKNDAGEEKVWAEKQIDTNDASQVQGEGAGAVFTTDVVFKDLPVNDAMYAQIKVKDPQQDRDNIAQKVCRRIPAVPEIKDDTTGDVTQAAEPAKLVLLEATRKPKDGVAQDPIDIVTINEVVTDSTNAKIKATTTNCNVVQLANKGVKTFDTLDIDKSDLLIVDASISTKTDPDIKGQLNQELHWNNAQPCNDLLKKLKFKFDAETEVRPAVEAKDAVMSEDGQTVLSPAVDAKAAVKISKVSGALTYTFEDKNGTEEVTAIPNSAQGMKGAEFIEGTSNLYVYCDEERGSSLDGAAYDLIKFAHAQGDGESADTTPAADVKHLVLGTATFADDKGIRQGVANPDTPGQTDILGILEVCYHDVADNGDLTLKTETQAAALAKLKSAANATHSVVVTIGDQTTTYNLDDLAQNDGTILLAESASFQTKAHSAKLTTTHTTTDQTCEHNGSRTLLPYNISGMLVLPDVDKTSGDAKANSYQLHLGGAIMDKHELHGDETLKLDVKNANGTFTTEKADIAFVAGGDGPFNSTGTFGKETLTADTEVKLTVSLEAQAAVADKPAYYANDVVLTGKTLMVVNKYPAGQASLKNRKVTLKNTNLDVENIVTLSTKGRTDLKADGMVLSIAKSTLVPAWVPTGADIALPTADSQSLQIGAINSDGSLVVGESASSSHKTSSCVKFVQETTETFEKAKDQAGAPTNELAGISVVFSTPQLVNDKDGNALQQDAGETDAEFKIRKAVTMLTKNGQLPADYDHTAFDFNTVKTTASNSVRFVGDVDTDLEGLDVAVHYKGTRSVNTATVSQTDFETRSSNLSEVCIQHYYDVGTDSDWYKRYQTEIEVDASKVTSECTLVSTEFITKEAIPYIKSGLSCAATVVTGTDTTVGLDAVTFKMEVSKPAHNDLANFKYAIKFSKGDVRQDLTGNGETAVRKGTVLMSYSTHGDHTHAELELDNTAGGNEEAGKADQHAYATSLSANAAINGVKEITVDGTNYWGSLVVTGTDTVFTVYYPVQSHWKTAEYECTRPERNPVVNIKEVTSKEITVDGTNYWGSDATIQLIGGFTDPDQGDVGSNLTFGIFHADTRADNQATMSMVKANEVVGTGIGSRGKKTIGDRLQISTSLEVGKDGIEIVTLKSLVNAQGGGWSYQCHEVMFVASAAVMSGDGTTEVDPAKVEVTVTKTGRNNGSVQAEA
jgi:hypothetical protein